MSEYAQAAPVKSLAAILFREEEALETALSRLAEQLSAIDYRSSAYPFEYSDYYRHEMGAGLRRLLVSFTALTTPERLVRTKHVSTVVEQEFARDGKRRVNIDPGYLDLYKLVLASFKGRGNKIYLGDGVWADPTLYYRKKAFHAFPWSFPDFKSGLFDQDLQRIRELYKRAIPKASRG